MSASTRTGKPASTSASGRFGVTRAAIGSKRVAQGGLGLAQQQAMAAFGDHHRIDDQRHARRMLPEGGGHGGDHLGAVQHAGLQRIGADVGQHDLDLLGDEGGLDRHDAMHALGILGGQSGDRGGGEGAHGGDRLDVGLDPGPAAGVGTGDDQDAAFHAAAITLQPGGSPR